MGEPDIRVGPPGPKGKEIVARDRRHLATSTKTAPVVIAEADGAVVQDVDGNRFIDFTSGVGVLNVGHRHPKVVAAIQAQLGKFLHFAGTDFYYDVQVRLAERLEELAPGDVERRVFLTNSGTEAIEAAMKAARWTTRRPLFLAFLGAFHGRTMGSLALTASRRVQRERFHPMMYGAVHVPYAYCYRCPYRMTYPDCDLYCADIVEEAYMDAVAPPAETAGLVVEPVQGEGGYIVPPPGWLKRIETICRRNDIPLIVDEIQTGFGRTGRVFASEHEDVVPDILAVAKALGSGLPIGAAVLDARFDFGEAGAHSNTFGGNPVACAAALATLDVLLDGDLLAHARAMGERMQQRLDEMQERYPIMGDNRGLGLMRATEFVDPETKAPAVETRQRILEAAFREGLILLPSGKSAIRYIPPLTIEPELLDAGLDALERAIAKATR